MKCSLPVSPATFVPSHAEPFLVLIFVESRTARLRTSALPVRISGGTVDVSGG
jgi:hypothetical protein